MRPVYQRLTAAGAGAWIPINRLQTSFAIGLGVKLSSNANLTYSVQFSMDDPNDPLNLVPCIATRSAGNVSVTKTNHGLSVNDWCKVWGAGANMDGEQVITSITDQNTFVYAVTASGVTSSGNGAWIQTARVFNHATLAAQTTSQTGNLAFPPTMVRLNITSFTAGYADLEVIQGRG